MKKIKSVQTLSRRSFMKLLAGAGITVTAAYVLFEVAPWLNYDQQASFSRRPFIKEPTLPAQMRDLVRYATLAASGHNTQPWNFAVKDNIVEIHPDYTHRLPIVDPNDRELWISLGCALENLLVAARAAGYAPEVSYPDVADFIQVRLSAAGMQSGPLFDAIPLRQNTRSVYDGQPIKTADLDQAQALPLEPGVSLHFVTNPAGLENVLEYVNQGNLSQYADKTFLDELIHWLRFNKKEALASPDGLYTLLTDNPEVPRWLGQIFLRVSKPQRQADADARKLRSSPGVILVSSEGDDKAAWVRTGQVYERTALKLTSLTVKSALLNQPIEVPGVRGQLQSAMGIGSAIPQLLVRFGYADPMPFSLRRPVEQVLLPS